MAAVDNTLQLPTNLFYSSGAGAGVALILLCE